MPTTNSVSSVPEQHADTPGSWGVAVQWGLPVLAVAAFAGIQIRSVWGAYMLAALVVATVVLMVGILRHAHRGGKVSFVAPLVIFFLSSCAQLYFLDNRWYTLALTALVGANAWLFCRAVVAYLYFPAKYPAATLSGLVSVLLLLSVFFGTGSAYALRVFLHPSLWLLIVLAVISWAAAFWTLGVWYALSARQLAWYIVVGALTAVELQTVTLFWPTSFYVVAFVLMSFTYLMHLSLLRAFGKSVLTPAVWARHVYAVIALDALVLWSARWI